MTLGHRRHPRAQYPVIGRSMTHMNSKLENEQHALILGEGEFSSMSCEPPFPEDTGPDSAGPAQKVCPACGASFTCGATGGQLQCWCCDLPHIMEMNLNAGCLCPTCLRREIDRRVDGVLEEIEQPWTPSADPAN